MTIKFNPGELKINWDKNAIKRLNQKIETVAKRKTSNTQKASDIASEAKKLGVTIDKKELKKMLDNGQIPKIEV